MILSRFFIVGEHELSAGLETCCLLYHGTRKGQPGTSTKRKLMQPLLVIFPQRLVTIVTSHPAHAPAGIARGLRPPPRPCSDNSFRFIFFGKIKTFLQEKAAEITTKNKEEKRNNYLKRFFNL
jgi:hypothetical protein